MVASPTSGTTDAMPAVPRPPEVVPAVFAGLTIGAQIAYPLLQGSALTALTITVVVLFTTASLTSAAHIGGWRTAAVVAVVAAGGGLSAELLGVATGFPFGSYGYAGTLGPQLGGVPVIIGLAWTMMAWPALLLGRRLAGQAVGRTRTLAVAGLGGLALASWDLFLDPQMTAAGHWAFANPDPGLPGVPGVPLTNYAGWALVSVLIIALLHVLVGEDQVSPSPAAEPRLHRIPAILLAWTWLGSTLANAVFFDRGWVALYGGLAMGALVGPYLVSMVRPTHRRSHPSLASAGAGT